MEIREHLLSVVERQVRAAFPDAEVQVGAEAHTGDLLFIVRKWAERRIVQVTSRFLRTEQKEFENALQTLTTLPEKLRRLKSGSTLKLTEYGIV